MSAAKKKKQLSKDDLRSLMKQQTQKAVKKIDSPLAKYNSLDQLVCVLCNQQIKSEKLWNAHILGRTHRENVAALKEKSSTKTFVFAKPTAPSPANNKKRKASIEGLPVDFFDVKADVSVTSNSQPQATKGILKNSKNSVEKQTANLALMSGYESDEEDSEKVESSTSQQPSGLPSDFFDSKPQQPTTGDEQTDQEPHTPSITEALPEGFFDDPKLDAKIRKVEFKNKLDDEWELFQRAMKEETSVSEKIVQQDDEIATEDRVIDEIDEQMHRYTQVDHLQKKKDEIVKTKKDDQKSENSDSDIDENEFEEFFDWRAKKS